MANKFCTVCRAPVSGDKKFCMECGAPIQNGEMEAPLPGSKYEPITTGGYIGIMLLMCIPIVGLILAIVWAFGGCRKVNKRNLARATLIMMLVSMVLSLIFGAIVGSMAKKAIQEIGVFSQQQGETLKDSFKDHEVIGNMKELGELMETLGDTSKIAEAGAEAETHGKADTKTDTNEEADFEALESLTGDMDIAGLIEDMEKINQEAEAANDGWPPELRAYPSGTATALTSYRTEISGTTLEEMKAYIQDLKKDGYEFSDFYDFGMSEADMLSMNGWWGTDGKIYLSISYSDGTVLIDHTRELPDLSSYFN